MTIKLRLTYGDMASLSCKSGRPKEMVILDIIIIKTMQHARGEGEFIEPKLKALKKFTIATDPI